MSGKKNICLFLIAAILVSGCGAEKGTGESAVIQTDVTSSTVFESETTVPASETEAAKFEFDPHLYIPSLADDIPQDHWESFYNLCDALRAGETTFECSDESAYNWATNWATLNALFPVECLKISGESNDGSIPYENGVGRIYYDIPVEEYVAKEAEFEKTITDIINSCVEYDDTDFEKCLKLYDYMESTFAYLEYEAEGNDGMNYYTLMNKKGLCAQLAGVYAYLLLQAGVEAISVGCYDPEVSHEWTYIVIDGKGYHSDPTWGLKDPTWSGDLGLYYFMMTDEIRRDSGCPVEDLNSPLLPEYWESRSSIDFHAVDESCSFPSMSFLESIDEENKIVNYSHFGEMFELKYE